LKKIPNVLSEIKEQKSNKNTKQSIAQQAKNPRRTHQYGMLRSQHRRTCQKA